MQISKNFENIKDWWCIDIFGQWIDKFSPTNARDLTYFVNIYRYGIRIQVYVYKTVFDYFPFMYRNLWSSYLQNCNNIYDDCTIEMFVTHNQCDCGSKMSVNVNSKIDCAPKLTYNFKYYNLNRNEWMFFLGWLLRLVSEQLCQSDVSCYELSFLFDLYQFDPTMSQTYFIGMRSRLRAGKTMAVIPTSWRYCCTMLQCLAWHYLAWAWNPQ